MRKPGYRTTVSHELERLGRDHRVVLRLRRLVDLVEEPDANPWLPDVCPGSGTEEAVHLLTAARHLPDDLVLQVELDHRDVDADELTRVTDGMHRLASTRAAECWREALAVRNAGLRQVPASVLGYIVAAGLAYGFAYIAQQTGLTALGLVLVVLAGLSMTVAWVASWMVMEGTLYDWRVAGRTARAYDLLSRSTVEVAGPAMASEPATDVHSRDLAATGVPAGQLTLT
jgi:hypothetical protein